jgi:AcrR family transcriptional regulator
MRTRDPVVTEAVLDATLELLGEVGFAGMTVEAVAARAGVGKPAIYRRYADKVALTIAAIATLLPELEVPELGDSRREMRMGIDRGWPPDADAYLALIGGLAAEHKRFPELIAAFRETILLPRRAIAQTVVERAQARGDVRTDVDPEMAIDLLAGPLLARAFAGRDTGPAWRDRAFDLWWASVCS